MRASVAVSVKKSLDKKKEREGNNGRRVSIDSGRRASAAEHDLMTLRPQASVQTSAQSRWAQLRAAAKTLREQEEQAAAVAAGRTADDLRAIGSHASKPGSPIASKPGSPTRSPLPTRRRPSYIGSAGPMGMAEARRASLSSDNGGNRRKSSAFADFTLQVRAATTIGRAWRKRTRGIELDRKNFVERLVLEDDVCVGVTRLILFVLLFVILYTVTLIGVPSAERRAAEIVLSQALSLEEFGAVRTLPAYREGMVKFSHAMKEFSASGSERFPDKDSIVVLGSAQTFTKAKPLTGLDLKISGEEFTITAWVEVVDESHSDKSILRKPLHTHPELSCWGWYFPSKFYYGAHDYNSIGMDMEHSWQVGVDAGAEFPHEFFNHEAIVVHNHTATFYRNGKILNEGGTPLPRTITDCLGTIEVGGPGLRISSMKFYARALNTAEILEINVNGQPLAEVATGSSLTQYHSKEHDFIIVEVDTVAHQTDELLENKDEKRVLDDLVANAELGESHEVVEAMLFPPDSSPPATLPPSEPAAFLPPHDLKEWQAGGSLRSLADVVTDRWTCDSSVLPGQSAAAASGGHRRAASAAAADAPGPTLIYNEHTVCAEGAYYAEGDAHAAVADAGADAHAEDTRRRVPREEGKRRAESAPAPYPGAYWSVVENPLYARASQDEEEDIQHESHDDHPLVEVNLTGVPEDTAALTFTFWVKAVRPESAFSLTMRLGSFGELDILGFHLMSYGSAVLRVTDASGHSWSQLAEDMFAARQVEGPLDEKFFITAYSHDPIPTVWRHVAVTFHLDDGYHESYLDGRLVRRHDWHAVNHIPIASLRGKHLSIAQAPFGHNVNKTLAKIAQLRMYPRALTQAEVQNVQDNAEWANHTPVKQCHELSEDKFMDSDGVDSHSRSCSWYHHMMEQTGSNLICKSSAAKKLCPLTCRGERECSAGYPFDGHVHDEKHRVAREQEHKHYRIFDRVMHLKPRSLHNLSASTTDASASSSSSSSSSTEGTAPATGNHRRAAGSASASASASTSVNASSEDYHTVICPGASQNKDALFAACMHPTSGNASYAARAHFYETWEESYEETWKEYHRADLTQCYELQERIDPHQCAWDDAWVPHFMEDLHDMQQFSVQWWSRPTEGSRLPVSTLNLFSTLVPPRTLLDVREQNPFEEATTRLAVPTSDGQLWSSVHHRGTIDFRHEWTFYYVKMQKVTHGAYKGEWQSCLAVNGFPLDCHHTPHMADFGEHLGQPFPESFLQAFEMPEGFISPIEFSTNVLSVSEVQELYYRLAPKMAKLTGPRTTELERMAARDTPPEKAAKSFSERLLVAAPPLLYQQRNVEEQCPGRAMGRFLEKQLELIQGTHCASGSAAVDICPGFHSPTDVYSCRGKAQKTSGEHYGMPVTALNMTDPPTYVFADFLYSVADNEVLVRGENHDILPALDFVDRATEEAVILCLFHSPDSGDTTVLDVKMSMDGSKLTMHTEFSHFGYLDADDRQIALVLWSCFFVLCALTFIWNIALFLHFYQEAKEFPDLGWDTEHAIECFYDLAQVALLVGYGVAKIRAQLTSEDEAEALVVEFVSVPFRDSSETVQTKVDMFFDAIVTMRELLSSEKTLQTLGFFVMLLMLIRIINTTAVHPRIGVLIGTVKAGLDDIWHYAILFLLVFCFASMVATWSFGTRAEFEDLETSMQTQFNLLLGNLPPGYDEDPMLIIYIVLSIVVQFFLMLNFLLAIIIENYMKVRQHIEDMQTENEFTYDVFQTFRFGTLGMLSNWPNRRRLGRILQTRCSRRNTSWIELFVLGVPRKVAIHLINTYAVLDVLPATANPERHTDMDRLGQMEERTLEHVSALEESVNVKFDAIMRLLQAMQPHAPHRDAGGALSHPPGSALSSVVKQLLPAEAHKHAAPDHDSERAHGGGDNLKDKAGPASASAAASRDAGLPHAANASANAAHRDAPSQRDQSLPPLVNSSGTTPSILPADHAHASPTRAAAQPEAKQAKQAKQAKRGSGDKAADAAGKGREEVDPTWVKRLPSSPQEPPDLAGGTPVKGRAISSELCFDDF